MPFSKLARQTPLEIATNRDYLREEFLYWASVMAQEETPECQIEACMERAMLFEAKIGTVDSILGDGDGPLIDEACSNVLMALGLGMPLHCLGHTEPEREALARFKALEIGKREGPYIWYEPIPPGPPGVLSA